MPISAYNFAQCHKKMKDINVDHVVNQLLFLLVCVIQSLFCTRSIKNTSKLKEYLAKCKNNCQFLKVHYVDLGGSTSRNAM